VCALSNVCLYRYHENVKLLLNVINKDVPEGSKIFRDFIDSAVCNMKGKTYVIKT
jgi:hypothetical protein